MGFMHQVTKYTVREVLNHKRLVHPHIVEMKEVGFSLVHCLLPQTLLCIQVHVPQAASICETKLDSAGLKIC